MNIPTAQGLTPVSETSDLKASFEELNDDTIDNEGFSNIDMRTKLSASQVPALVALDILCNSGVYPQSFARVGRSIKRTSISINGGGRKDMVSIAKGHAQASSAAGQSVVQRAQGE